jgi:hypothetical protein
MWTITTSLAVQSDQIMKTALKFDILALFRRTSISYFLLPVQLFAPLPVILPPQILGCFSTTSSPAPRLPGGILLETLHPEPWTWQLSLMRSGDIRIKTFFYAKTKNL